MGRDAWQVTDPVHGVAESGMTELLSTAQPRTYWVHDFSDGSSGEEPNCQCKRCKRCGSDPWVGKIPWRRAWNLTAVFLLGEPHGWMSLVGNSP